MGRAYETLSCLWSSHWRGVVLTTTSAFIGILANYYFDNFTRLLFTKDNLASITFVVTSLIFFATVAYTAAMWRAANQKFTSIEKHIGQRIRILSYSDGFKELRQKIESAEFEILVLSNYVFDWDGKKHLYDPETMQGPERKATFEATQEKLRHERLQRRKGKKFKFVKIVQIPKGHNLDEVLPHDPIYEDDCKFLAELAGSESEFASLHLSEVVFYNTFCIIDESFLYLEFDVQKPNIDQTFSPFTMIIEDPDSKVITTLRTLHQRLEKVSSMITRIA